MTTKQASGKLAERLEKLETASEKWKKRVAAPDAVQYSIYGKMKVDHSEGLQSAVLSPLIQAVENDSNKGKKLPRAERFKVERGNFFFPFSVFFKPKTNLLFFALLGNTILGIRILNR